MDHKALTGKLDRLNNLMGLHFASYFEDLPLTSTQAVTLEFIIQKAKFGEVFQKDLEGFLTIRGSSVASLINNLERDGYIHRKAVAFDGRYKHLAPTQKALDLQRVISERIDQYIESLFVNIPDGELQAFESVMEKMERNIC